MDSELNLQDLYNWVDSHALSRQKKNLNRDFSDAVPLAEILKQHFPRWVDLHNYAPKNSVARKLDNWYTINRKVLCKLDIQLSQNEMIRLAKSVPGAIEDLLFKIKQKVEEYEREDAARSTHNSQENIPEEKTVQQTMVPLALLEKQALELDIKNEAIQILNQKVNQLQSTIEAKDTIIEELQKTVAIYIKKQKSSLFDVQETMVPANLLEKKILELEVKNEALNLLNEKVKHLQSLIDMKDEHIEILQKKVDDYVKKENACFFNKFLK